MLDLLIQGGTLVDGTGAPRRQGDVGIRDGRIVAVGEVNEEAKRVVDATGLVVAPGFIDSHTHFDAQVFWDGAVTPSPQHGVTTIVGGNCGFSVAPLSDESGPYLMRMLARVEGIPVEALEEGVPWSWRSFDEYLSALEGKLAVNAAFMVGHSAIRRAVMAEDAITREATADELAAMQRLLAESLEAGGLGFSSTLAPTHNDDNGVPVPSRWASHDEIVALCRTVRDHEGTTLEFIPGVGVFNDEQVELMTEMSLAANRPLNWNVLVVQSFTEPVWRAQLEVSDRAAAKGAKVVALTPSQVMALRLNFRSGFILDTLPGWPEVISLPLEEKKKVLADPEKRAELDARANSDEAGVMRALAVWGNATITETFTEANEKYEGRKVGEIAEELGKTPFDTLVDICLSEDLQTTFSPFIPGDDDASWKMRAETWLDDRTIVGASDAGAHLDMINTFMCTTSLLGAGVREKGLVTLEQAVEQLTRVPAEHYGLKNRGVLTEGAHADVTIFDPATVGPHEMGTQHDLPAGAGRLYAEANGIAHVIVGGVEILTDGKLTGASPGTVLRSGRDTDTVEVPGGAAA